MAITFFGGPPGAGKSYALVEQVIVPGVQAGRRVLTNVAGVDPEKVWRYCAERTDQPDKLGEVVRFEGRDAVKPGFWPTETIPDAQTFVKGGDLIVFDEWRLYWPRRGQLPCADLEPFLRWHRHLVNADGVACDVAIASQLATDVHQDFRGLIERSYKFRKLKAVGLSKGYAWHVFEGHLQPKGGQYDSGNGTYKDEITALYSSYSTSGKATELQTDKRATIFKGWLLYAVGGSLFVLALSAWAVYRFFATGAGYVDETQQPATAPLPGQPVLAAPNPPRPAASGYRIVGQISGAQGSMVIVETPDGIRVLPPDDFTFRDGRPVQGLVDGAKVYAQDRVKVAPSLVPQIGVVP